MENKMRNPALGIVLLILFLLTPLVFFLENITLKLLIVGLQFALLGLVLYMLRCEKNIRKIILQVIVVVVVLSGLAIFIFNRVVSSAAH